jgi:erythromycin esterase-like protein
MTDTAQLRAAVHRAYEPIAGDERDYDGLLARIGAARLVLLGEATHGSHEFYHERTRITQRLIEERDFDLIAVEADWPDAYRVNRYVRGTSDDASAHAALAGFQRFPSWMWRNTDIVRLVDWLRDYNAAQPARPVGFYGIDLYSMYASIDAVIRYLETADPEAAARARQRYACFEHFGEDSQAYGYAANLGLTPSCEQEATAQLIELRKSAAELAHRDGRIPEDEFFFAEQNARLIGNAEEYYRTMFRGRVSSWNVRDRHMADTLDALIHHFDGKGGRSRVVVWAHNSHIGDARATQMGGAGEWNVGQLARQRWGDDAVLVGFTTHAGTVTAAADWDAPAQRMTVRPALPGSYEALFHEVDEPRFVLPLRENTGLRSVLEAARLERAIGVVYRTGSERTSHYFRAVLPRQFDAVLHFDVTSALEPLEVAPGWAPGEEAPETYPFTVG